MFLSLYFNLNSSNNRLGICRTNSFTALDSESLQVTHNATNQGLRSGVSGIDSIATSGTKCLPICYGNTLAQTSINGSTVFPFQWKYRDRNK